PPPQGFCDALEIAGQLRQQMSEVALDPETPTFLAPGRFRREVRERISPAGAVLVPLDEAAVAAAADELIGAGVQAIAVVFLFSFLNDAHERRAREIIAAHHPDIFLSLSSEVDPAFREYELRRYDLRCLRQSLRGPLSRQSRCRALRRTCCGPIADHAVARRDLRIGDGAVAAGAAVSVGAGCRGDRRSNGWRG